MDSSRTQFQKISRLLKKDNVTILDIGTNLGQELPHMVNYITSGTIYCFEPNKKIFEQLKENLKSLVYDKKSITILPINAAISNVDGNIKLRYNHSSSGYESGTIKTPKVGIHECYAGELTEENVVSYKLDSWIENNNIGEIELIWADVEGAMEELIMGGEKTLTHTNHIFIETVGWYWENSWNREDIKNNLINHSYNPNLSTPDDGFFSKKN